jgi:GAF domain-containing protein/anti-sigma regulatory factor (Ser/Thr protein kinase)
MINDDPNKADFAKLQQEIINLRSQLKSVEDCASEPAQVLQQKALLSVVTRIRESLELQSIFDSTATEVRQLLNVDRVTVYCFDPDSGYNQGRFVAEDVLPPYRTTLAARVEDHCFGGNFAAYYQLGKIWAAADIYALALKDCHIAILEQFQVRASLVVPLHKGNDLWGLLCIHSCAAPHDWQDTEIEFVQQIAMHLSVALQQAEAMNLLNQQSQHLSQAIAQAVDREKATARIINKIRRSLEVDEIFRTTTLEVRQLLDTDRVAIYRFNADWSGEFVAEAVTSDWLQLVGENIHTLWQDDYLQKTKGGRYANHETSTVDDIHGAAHSECHIKMLEHFQIRAYAIAPIFLGQTLWGLLGAYQNAKPRHWQQSEINFLQQIAAQFSIALQQAKLLNQAQQRSQELEQTLIQLQVEVQERKKAEHIATQALAQEKDISHLKSKLIATISHELRTPLSLIMLLSEALESRYHKLTNEKRSQKFAQIKVNVNRIIQVIEDAITINQKESEANKFSPVPLNLEDLCPSLLTEWQRDKNLKHQVDYICKGQHPICAQLDPALLKQLIFQLLANAVRYSPKGGNISFELLDDREDSDWVLIRISDRGIGIPTAEQTKIFEQFYRATNADHISGTPGAGLGLAIVKQITDLHKGDISLESKVDEGSSFTIRLPKNLS